ncbi:hypothetical protein FPF71_13095 [Algibacter amylolyticus]|uniref:Uncharacterized protein n=1 Tax=Algibacter amylolyticus TaxID=1608400 RepID=A0A5M7B882_9FLAO|nr:DUF6452 family protein [Algibacter amylolyticus]KAA5823631.1 hypothetical protein F2B50_13095 [Algibacter amylolyticus]MBB5267793.1 hypothetical protein [Algibacter amylolyticus]TSJ74119.1 hypothetical protein FPF71_13095 [Algibacter amylolyticus]
MKKISLLFIILIIVGNYSCERDDICPDSTPTTPRLIIDFIDATDSDIFLNVSDLVVIGVENDEFLDEYLEDYVFTNTDNVILPLKTTDNTTEYILVSDAEVNDNDTPDDDTDDFIDGNYDKIIINYSREEVYVSRACGYKTIFKNVTLTIVEDDDNWMISRQPLTDNQSVEDETTTHFNISH